MGHPSPYNHHLFVAYCSKNRQVVRALVKRLRAENLQVWFAEQSVDPGAPFPDEILAALKSSRFLIACVSKHIDQSPWWMFETKTFVFEYALTSPNRIIPLRLDSHPLPGHLRLNHALKWSKKYREASYQALLAKLRLPLGDGGAESEPVAPHVRALSPNGKLELSSSDETIQLRTCAGSGKPRILTGHKRRVEAIAWRLDSRGAASGSSDGTICIWDLKKRSDPQVLSGHRPAILCLAYDKDPRALLSGSRDGTLRLWDLETVGSRVIGEHGGSVNGIAWNPNPRFALTTCEDKIARLFDLTTGKCVAMKELSAAGRAVSWTPNPAHAIVTDSAGRIYKWDLTSKLAR